MSGNYVLHVPLVPGKVLMVFIKGKELRDVFSVMANGVVFDADADGVLHTPAGVANATEGTPILYGASILSWQDEKLAIISKEIEAAETKRQENNPISYLMRGLAGLRRPAPPDDAEPQ